MSRASPIAAAGGGPVVLLGAELPGLRLPRQRRSRATVDFILAAAEELLLAGGVTSISTTGVAARAGVSIGSLYQYFPTRDAILAALKRRADLELAGIYARVLEAGPSRSLEGAIRDIVEALIARHLERGALHLILEHDIVFMTETPYPLAVDRIAGMQHLRRLLDEHADEIGVGDLGLASFIIGKTLRAVINGALLTFPDRLVSGAIADELTRFVLRYLAPER